MMKNKRKLEVRCGFRVFYFWLLRVYKLVFINFCCAEKTTEEAADFIEEA